MKNKIVNGVKDAVANSFNFPQIDSDLTVWFIFEGKEYELSQFNISFGQGVDHKGQPQDEVRGGRMLLSLTQALPESIYKWAMTSCARSGEVVFRSKTANAPLRVEFTNAYCVNFERKIDTLVGLISDLMISPEEVLINGLGLDNHWV